MALFHITYTDVENRALAGVVMPALRGGPATFLTLSATTSALVQDGVGDFTAPADGFVEMVCDAPGYVRFALAADTTDAAAGDAWPLQANLPKVLSIRKNQQIRCAAA